MKKQVRNNDKVDLFLFLIVCVILLTGCNGEGSQDDGGQWQMYGRDYTNQRYSPLDQLDTENVKGLRL
ncbi:MAG: hypothetical protein OEQ53_08310, partial [Saprospiraceae bacterium]|nr:hypothetical protein [Saprospiraceae bacterium]